MEIQHDKLLISKTISLRREFSYVHGESQGKTIPKAINKELFALTQSLMGFIGMPIEDDMGNDRNDMLEIFSSGIAYLNNISDTINEKYSTLYLKEISQKKKISFEQIQKPQHLFKDVIDNSESPFVPKIKEKYNKLVDLEVSLSELQKMERIPENAKINHPYKVELENFNFNTTLFQKILSKNIQPKDFLSTKPKYIDKLEDLKSLSELLEKESIFSFDVHNHSFRSYQGFICFLEISTESDDYVIDCLKLRENIHILNSSFTNPQIYKLALDSSEKLQWLQRDFGLYVVNLIELKLLLDNQSLPNSLAFLANKFLDFSFKSIYLEFDFRKRPVNNQERAYLRSFSYLIFNLFFKIISLVLRNNPESLFKQISEDSKKLCLNQYKKPSADEGYLSIFNSLKNSLNVDKLTKLKKIVAWRDLTARLEDESREYILPEELIIKLLQEAPKDIESMKNLLISNDYQLSSNHSESIFSIIEDRNTFQDKKSISKNELENGNELMHSLFTPSRSIVKVFNNLSEKESPAYDQNEIHKLIHWSSGKKTDFGEVYNTPRKNFDEFISKGVLTPSILKDSPSENIGDELMLALNAINNRNDTSLLRREMLKFSSFKGSDTKLKEIKEEEQIDVLDFMTAKENIPQNIGEIYELGNNIRKKNKNKKRKEIKGSRFPGDTNFVDGFQPTTPQKLQDLHLYQNRCSIDDDQVNSESILRDLGWIDQ